MREADEGLLRRVAAEIERALGDGVGIVGVLVDEAPGAVRLTADCTTPVGEWRLEAVGPTMIAAIAALHRRAVEDRVAIGFREVIAGR